MEPDRHAGRALDALHRRDVGGEHPLEPGRVVARVRPEVRAVAGVVELDVPDAVGDQRLISALVIAATSAANSSRDE